MGSDSPTNREAKLSVCLEAHKRMSVYVILKEPPMPEIAAVLLVITIALSAVVFAQQQVIRQQRDALQRVCERENAAIEARIEYRWNEACKRWKRVEKELGGEQ